MFGAPSLSLITIPPELPWLLIVWMKGLSSKDIFCPLPINACGYCFQLFPALTVLKRKCRLSIAEGINLSSFPPVTLYASVYSEIWLYSYFFTCTLLWLEVDLSCEKGTIGWLIDWLSLKLFVNGVWSSKLAQEVTLLTCTQMALDSNLGWYTD